MLNRADMMRQLRLKIADALELDSRNTERNRQLRRSDDGNDWLIQQLRKNRTPHYRFWEGSFADENIQRMCTNLAQLEGGAALGSLPPSSFSTGAQFSAGDVTIAPLVAEFADTTIGLLSESIGAIADIVSVYLVMAKVQKESSWKPCLWAIANTPADIDQIKKQIQNNLGKQGTAVFSVAVESRTNPISKAMPKVASIQIM